MVGIGKLDVIIQITKQPDEGKKLTKVTRLYKVTGKPELPLEYINDAFRKLIQTDKKLSESLAIKEK